MSDSRDDSRLEEIYAQAIVDVDSQAIGYGLAFYCRSDHIALLGHYFGQQVEPAPGFAQHLKIVKEA